VWYYDGTWWIFCGVDGNDPHVFHRGEDLDCHRDLGTTADEAFQRGWERLKADAGGDLPDYRDRKRTDAIGQRPMR
jgi:hypothetical protein